MAIDNRLKDIHIDWTGEFYYGYDQIYDSFPCVFPTVSLVVYGEGLPSLACDVLRSNGESEESLDRLYDFYVGLNGYTKTHIDTYIDFVSYSCSDDNIWRNDEVYQIPLNTEEQNYIYNLLDEQLRKGGYEDGVDYKASCEELLEEAAKEYERVAGGKLTILGRSA